jgi:hypothetical protein
MRAREIEREIERERERERELVRLRQAAVHRERPATLAPVTDALMH